MTHGHGAEPAPQEIHRGDGKAQLGDGGRASATAGEVGDLAHEFGCERRGGDDGVECCEGKLGDGHGPGLGLAEAGDHGERVPDLEGREAVVGGVDGHGDDGQDEACKEQDQGVGKVLGCARCQDKQQERGDGPDPVVERGIDPAQFEQHVTSARDDELQSRPELDPLHNRDRDPRRQPAQQARDAQDAHGGTDQRARGEGLFLRGMRGDSRSRNGLHGLYGERHAEEDAGENVEEAREDEGAGQGDGALQGEGDHQREEGAQVAEGAGDLRNGAAAEGGEVVPV